jgi:hypothetical protein
MTTAPQTDPFSADAAAAANFLGGGTVAAKFPTEGFVVEGTILSFRMAQQTHMKSGELLFWEGKDRVEQSKLKYPATAKPVEQLVIEMQCEPTGITWESNRYVERQLPDDDGVRTLYVKGGLAGALGKALRDAGVRAPEDPARQGRQASGQRVLQLHLHRAVHPGRPERPPGGRLPRPGRRGAQPLRRQCPAAGGGPVRRLSGSTAHCTRKPPGRALPGVSPCPASCQAATFRRRRGCLGSVATGSRAPGIAGQATLLRTLVCAFGSSTTGSP